MKLLAINLIENVGYVISALVAAFTAFKLYKEHLQSELDKLKVREDAKVLIAKEQSVGKEAIDRMRQVQEDFKKRIEELEKDLREGFHLAERDRSQINESLERLKREHTEFINKSLEYFMGRKA